MVLDSVSPTGDAKVRDLLQIDCLHMRNDGRCAALAERHFGVGKDADKTQVYTCLATSTDGGRSFQKPNLSVIAWNGTKDNNIVWPP